MNHPINNLIDALERRRTRQQRSLTETVDQLEQLRAIRDAEQQDLFDQVDKRERMSDEEIQRAQATQAALEEKVRAKKGKN